MKRMNEIETNDVKVKPSGTINSGTMTYEAHKLGSMYIVYVNSTINWEEGGNGWVFMVKDRMASGTWISGNTVSSLIAGGVGGNPSSGVAILY